MKIVRFKFCESYKLCKFLSWHKRDGTRKLSYMNVPLNSSKKTVYGSSFSVVGWMIDSLVYKFFLCPKKTHLHFQILQN